MKTMLFNPYTGTPRHPSDIKSDPQGLLIVEPDAPVAACPDHVDGRHVFDEAGLCYGDTCKAQEPEPSPTAGMTMELRKLFDLPLGTWFKYPGTPGGPYVFLSRDGAGLVCDPPKPGADRVFQGVYSAADSPVQFRELMVEVVAVAPVAPAPALPDAEAIAQFIRAADGAHQMGAAALAERLHAWLCPPRAETPAATTIEEAARDVGKCLNERNGHGLDLRHVAMLVHHAQKPDNRVPMGRIAERKLADLQAQGHNVCGVMIHRTGDDGTITRGAVSDGGMVIWWHPEQAPALYEELRAAIDSGSETATHEDALAWVKSAHQTLADVGDLTLTEDQCNTFRRLPMPFNDMVRAIHRAGVEHRTEPSPDDIKHGMRLYHHQQEVLDKIMSTKSAGSPYP